jgi:hypothetical protein
MKTSSLIIASAIAAAAIAQPAHDDMRRVQYDFSAWQLDVARTKQDD